MAGVLSGFSFRSIDAFGTTTQDVKVKTRSGAILTLVSAIFIVTLTAIEWFDSRKINVDTAIFVDKSRGEKLTVSMNITFPRVPCYLLNLDVVDVTGEHQRDFLHHVVKTRLDQSWQPISGQDYQAELKSELSKILDAKTAGYCGSCYGGLEPVSGCCNTCEEVREAYVGRGWAFSNPELIEQCVAEGWKEKIAAQSSEGCNLAGQIRINKVVGNIQISPGRSFVLNKPDVYELVPYLKDSNHYFGHFIHEFKFQAEGEGWTRALLAPGVLQKYGMEEQPLKDVYSHAEKHDWMFQYFMKVVSTKYIPLSGIKVKTHQYSVTSYERDLTESQFKKADGTFVVHERQGVPGAFFSFEISPMQVVHSESRQSFAHFLTSMVAIIGGVLTLASLFDTLVFTTERAIKKGAAAVAEEKRNGYTPGVSPVVKLL